MMNKYLVKWTASIVFPMSLLAACATTTAQKDSDDQLSDTALQTIHLGLKTPKPSQCRFLNTITIKSHNKWLKNSKSAHQLREQALREMLSKAHNDGANYIHVRQISSETMGVFTYDYTSSVMATGDAFHCHKMPDDSPKAASYLKQKHFTLES